MFRFFGLILALVLLLGLTGNAANAQDGTNQLTLGQPLSITIANTGETVNLAYSLSDTRVVTLQAMSDSAQPTLTILQGTNVVAEESNAAGGLNITLNAFLTSGDYVVELGAVNGSTGSIIIAVQGEAALTPISLTIASPVEGEVTAQTPLVVYSFAAQAEPAHLYVDSLLANAGLQMRVRNLTTGRISSTLAAELLGTRLTIPAGTAEYQLEVAYVGLNGNQSFSVCFSLANQNGCETSAPQASDPVPSSAACTITPAFAGGANIRTTVSIDAPVVLPLPGGATAEVIGISPDGNWYNVSYNGYTGWAALSAVVANGNCAALVVNTPPAVPTPVPPTPVVVAPPQDNNPPQQDNNNQPQPTPAPSGPCVATFSADEMVYTRPQMAPDYYFDQVTATGELILNGRLNTDPSWFRTSYNGWWYNGAGTAGTLSGGCDSLPLVSWP